jgi:hypothetical protein
LSESAPESQKGISRTPVIDFFYRTWKAWRITNDDGKCPIDVIFTVPAIKMVSLFGVIPRWFERNWQLEGTGC